MIDAKEPTVAAIELAQRYYREFYILCFWHMKPDLIVTESNILSVVDGLRKHGGRKGMLAAAEVLRARGSATCP